MATLVLTVVGDDRAGLVHALADVVNGHGGNWERSQMAELAGTFAGIVVVSVPDDRVDELTRSLRPLDGLLEITAHRAGGPAAPAPGARARFTLELVGGDRPGIVQQITGVLERHDMNVEMLETDTRDAPMAGGRLFEARASLEASADLDVAAVRAALEQLAQELMVDIDLERADMKRTGWPTEDW